MKSFASATILNMKSTGKCRGSLSKDLEHNAAFYMQSLAFAKFEHKVLLMI